MPFKKGVRLPNQGGNHGGGRLTKNEVDFRNKVKKEIDRLATRRAKEIASKYLERATANGGDRVLMHLVDRAYPKLLELGGPGGGPIEVKWADEQ